MKHITIAVTAILFAACGPESTTSEPEKRNVYLNNINRTPISLFKEYESCEGAAAQSNSPYFYLTQFLRGSRLGRQLDMSSALSGGELKGFQIEQTFYDAEMRFTKTVREGRLVGSEFEITKSPRAMSICPGIKSYQRYSYENASMNATYAISKTVERLREVNYSAGTRVKVYVSPYTIERRVVELRDRIIKEDLRLTDNAFYLPHLSSVVFMPQSEESRDGGGFGNIPLWEVPMVGSHEYAHHVFHSVMNSASAELADYNHSCFTQNPVEAQAQALQVDSVGPRTVGVADVLGALNEGFADLIAYYTLDEGERGLRGVVCMETSREVGSAVFPNNEPKLFSENMMDTFLSGIPQESVGCFDPNFQQIHTVGAVFANVSERLMSSMGLTKKQKLSLMITWLKDMNKAHPRISSLGAERYLVKSYSLLASRAMEMADAVPSQECDQVEFFMPSSDYSYGELQGLGCR